MQVCKGCGESKPLDAFYMGRRGRPRGKCKECCKASWPKSGKRTAQQRADYRRRTGQTTVEYKPKAVLMAEAAAKREAALAAKHDAHVSIWRRECRRLHNAHVAEWKRSGAKFRHLYNSDPEFAAKQRLRTQLRKKMKLHPKLDDLMRDAIKRGGTSKTVEAVCGYSIAQLVSHLASLFQPGMSWEAFLAGEIHIDHKTPQAAFDLTTIEGVRACWAMANLQPLWAEDNRAKSDRIDGVSVRAARSGERVLGTEIERRGHCARPTFGTV